MLNEVWVMVDFVHDFLILELSALDQLLMQTGDTEYDSAWASGKPFLVRIPIPWASRNMGATLTSGHEKMCSLCCFAIRIGI